MNELSQLDILTIVVFSVLCFLAGYLLPRHWVWELNHQITRHTPRKCPMCKTWHLTKKMRCEKRTTGHVVVICKACYDAEFRPVSSTMRDPEQ